MPKVTNNSRPEDVLDPLEESYLKLLQESLHRMECASKAAARIENQIVELYIEEQQEPTTNAEEITEAEGSPSSREFDTSKFLSLFESLNTLKTVEGLIELLGLQPMEADIMKLISFRELRGRAGAAGEQRSGAPEQFIGSAEEFVMKVMRDDAEKQEFRRRRKANG